MQQILIAKHIKAAEDGANATVTKIHDPDVSGWVIGFTIWKTPFSAICEVLETQRGGYREFKTIDSAARCLASNFDIHQFEVNSSAQYW